MKLNVFLKGKFIKIFTIIFNIFSYLKADKFERDLIKNCNNLSFNAQTTYSLWNTLETFNRIYKNKTQGSIVECGVWKGLNLIFFQKLIQKYNLKENRIYGYDTFEGTITPKEHDINSLGESMKLQYDSSLKDDGSSGWCDASEEEVKNNFIQNTQPNDNLVLIKGKVEETLLNNDNIPNKISLLRLDTSLYEGTKIELEKLFPKIQKGGVLIVEGYGQYRGVKKATDDYLESKIYEKKYNSILGRMIVYI
mgnify:CR=1 FL=1|tara:strand:- start:354 stop:1106 length:753 start_codon:yes stop_codon:yes gene_type:complete